MGDRSIESPSPRHAIGDEGITRDRRPVTGQASPMKDSHLSRRAVIGSGLAAGVSLVGMPVFASKTAPLPAIPIFDARIVDRQGTRRRGSRRCASS